MMNVTTNSSRHFIEGQRTTLNVMGNNNLILIRDSEVVATINGNQNIFRIQNSRLTITFNGNMNQVQSSTSAINFGFNGNNNIISHNQSNEYRMQFCNGIGNQFPNQNNQPRQQPRQQDRQPPNRNNRNPQRNVFQYQYQQQGNRNQPQRPNNFEFSYPNYPNQFYQMPQIQDYYFQQPYPNVGGFNGWNNMPIFGNEGFFANMEQTMNNLFGGQSRRNYQFQPRNRQFQFQMNPMGMEIRHEEQQSRGLTLQQMSILPRSKHSGKQSHCSICLCEVEQGQEETYLMCFHSFHWECIQEWMKKKGQCPVCQFNVKAHLRGQEQDQ